jgi:HSP20 family molecular chaperone IbpA
MARQASANAPTVARAATARSAAERDPILRAALPAGVDTEKIEASFKKGVLTATLPQRPAAHKPEKKTEVNAAA